MNAKQKLSALHARELRIAKENLLRKVNAQIQSAQKEGYYVEVTPQLSRLIDLGSYRKRDVIKINQLANNPEKLKQYIYSVNQETGEIVSGEQAITRYESYRRSGLYRAPHERVRSEYEEPSISKPIREQEKMIDSVAESIEESFVDDSALRQFREMITGILSNPASAISDNWWGLAHPDWNATKFRGNTAYAKEEMVKENVQRVYEIRDALEHLISSEGIKAVAQRISDNFEALQDATIMAAIGYNNAAASALQQALIILLPTDRQPGNIRHRISDMQEVIEGQFEDYGE